MTKAISRQTARKVIISVPPERSAKLETFLKKALLDKKLIQIARRDVTIYEISKEHEREIPAKQFEVWVCGNNAVTKRFIASLFENHLIPAGKEWTVYGPIRVSA